MSATDAKEIEVVDEQILQEKIEKHLSLRNPGPSHEILETRPPQIGTINAVSPVGHKKPPEKPSPFEDRLIRQAFIRKVFLIMTIQLLITSLVVAPLLLIEPARKLLIEERSIFFFSILAFWIIYSLIVCAYGINRIWPLNYVMLTLLTLSLSVVIASACALINFTDILIAIALTAGLCFTLGSLASLSQFDFTVLTGVLSTLLFTLLILIFLYFIVPSKVLIWFILVFGITIVIMYFIIDIEMIVIGKHRYILTPQDYVAAATLLYVDIVFIFTFLIMMLLRRF